MSSNPSFNAPVLNYVGSVDVASATSGTTLYNILFDSSLCTAGNILMFEYKIQPSNVSAPAPENITLGYVNVENAIFNSGIQNQWTIAVPALNNQYDPPTAQEISVRVYSGLTGTTEIAVSPWSNTLDVHVPPVQPVIDYAIFSQNQLSPDDLWVYMTPSSEYNYDDVSFIVAYYFNDINGETVWSVSDPLSAAEVDFGNGRILRQLEVPNIGNVDEYHNVVHVAVYAVYPFSNDYNMYYSVSEISATYNALPATDFTAPTITDLTYNVYNSPFPVPGDQTMVVYWTAPETAQIPQYAVERYVLQKLISPDTIWSNVDENIPSTTFTYSVDVSGVDCGHNVSFRVFAVSNSGQESATSNVESLNIFKYSLTPRNLDVTSTTKNSNSIDIGLTFQTPSNIGCGAGIQFVIVFTDIEGEQVTKYVPYTGAETYTPYYSDLSLNSVGIISVYLETQDTNSSDLLASESISTPYIVSNLILDPINYEVYTNRSQNMILTWNDPTENIPGYHIPGWSVSSYTIYLDNQPIDTVSGTINEYTYLATQSCGTNLTFKVVANLENDGTSFTLASNTESINIFKYATAPTSVIVNWASTDVLEQIIDLAVTFTVPNPYDHGCGNPIGWVVNVTNQDGSTILATQNVSYTEGTTTYVTYLNDVQYVANGRVYVFMQTEDTNNNGILDGAAAFGNFTSAALPIFTSTSINNGRTILNFTVISQTALSNVARFLWSTYSSTTGIVRFQKQFKTYPLVNIPGESVTLTTLENGVLQYTYSFAPEFFGLSIIPVNLTIAVSNDVGIQVENVLNA